MLAELRRSLHNVPLCADTDAGSDGSSGDEHYPQEAVRSVVALNFPMFSRCRTSSGASLHSVWTRVFLLLLVVLCCVPAARADADSAAAAALLSDMSKALREKDYRGLFTYEFGGVLQTLRVTHRVMEGEEYENVEYLNGPSRRVERNGRQVECLSAADQVLRGLLPGLNGEAGYGGLQKNYQFLLRDDERIAGREATVVQVIPRDDYRYGYMLSIDKQTSLPLGAMIMASNRKVLERVQFASLELTADDSWVGAVGAAAQVKGAAAGACDTPADALEWALGWVPDGFVIAGRAHDKEVGEMQLYTDGLATFSVFLEPMNKNVAAQGKAQRGATVAYMQQHVFNGKPHTVTVVGEIPAVAAQRIAGSIYWHGETPASATPGLATPGSATPGPATPGP